MSRHKSRPGHIRIDPYYRFVLLAAQQAGVLNENEKVCDQLGLSLRKFHANLEEIPKRCWKRLDSSIEAVLHLSFLFCGVEAFSILLRHNISSSIELPPDLENNLNGLNRLVRKIVKRTLDDRDWKEDILTVLREAQRVSVLIFYMLKSGNQSNNTAVGEAIAKETPDGRGTSGATVDAYIKGRVERLVKQLDDILATARTASNGSVRALADPALGLRTDVVSFATAK